LSKKHGGAPYKASNTTQGDAQEEAPEKQRNCLYCHDEMNRQEGHCWCPHCKIVMHKDCAEEMEKCPTLGCGKDFINYIPLTLESKESDSIAFFGISPGQVLYYAPLLAIFAGLFVSAEMYSLFFKASMSWIIGVISLVMVLGLNFILNITGLIDRMINLLAGRSAKLLMTNAPLLSLSAWFFYRSSEWALWDESFESGPLTAASVLLAMSLLTVIGHFLENKRMKAISNTEQEERRRAS
jgi:hypothetical protein